MESVSVLFVCTGNICRSPTAEAVFRHLVREAGLSTRFEIDSAGTHGYHIGDPPDPRAIATALKHGINMHDLRARKVAKSDFDRFQYIVAMDHGHYSSLSNLCRAETTSCCLIPFLKGGEEVADPYYGTLQGFEDVYQLIWRGSEALLREIKQKLMF